MTAEPLDLETLLRALWSLEERWDERSRTALETGRQQRASNTHMAYYYRGVGDGIRVALKDLQELLTQTLPAYEETAGTIPLQAETYAIVSLEAARTALEKSGLHPAELRAHPDHTFSAIFSPLGALMIEERVAALDSGDLVDVLHFGTLPGSNRMYLDFAFQRMPD